MKLLKVGYCLLANAESALAITTFREELVENNCLVFLELCLLVWMHEVVEILLRFLTCIIQIHHHFDNFFLIKRIQILLYFCFRHNTNKKYYNVYTKL